MSPTDNQTTPCVRCKCHANHYPRAQWDCDSDTDCCMGKTTERAVPCDEFEPAPDEVDRSFEALVTDSCAMARHMIFTCDLLSSTGPRRKCSGCFKLADKSCDARKWLERFAQPDAWEVNT